MWRGAGGMYKKMHLPGGGGGGVRRGLALIAPEKRVRDVEDEKEGRLRTRLLAISKISSQ